MKRPTRIALLFCLICLLPFGTMLGCTGQKEGTSPEDVKSFKGGPMPPEWQKKMAAIKQNGANAAAQAQSQQH